MYQVYRGFLISKINYSDSLFILKLYTQEEGIKTFFYRKSKKKNKNALLQSLSFLELSTKKSKGDISFVSSIEFAFAYQTIPFDVVKSSLIMFLNEVLDKTLKEEERNKPLFVYIEYCLRYLDEHDDVSNFHLYFLIHYTKHLGFFPLSEISNPNYLDVKRGKFTLSKPNHEFIIEGSSVDIIDEICRGTIEEMDKIKIQSNIKRQVLRDIIYLFEYHFDIRKVKSLDVLEVIFS